MITDLGSDFEPFVDEVLNKNGGVTKIKLSMTTNPEGSAIPQHQMVRVGERVNWGYDECPWTKGISTIRPEKSVTRTFYDEYGKAVDYICQVTHRELKQGETIVQKYRMADFALSQLRRGIQGTARMLPIRAVSREILPVEQGLIQSSPLLPTWQTLMMIMITSQPPMSRAQAPSCNPAMRVRMSVLRVAVEKKGGKSLATILLTMFKGEEQPEFGIQTGAWIDKSHIAQNLSVE
jgi:hypothetical protein